MTWGYALLLALLLPAGLGLGWLAIDRLALIGARRCSATVTAVQVRRGMTGSPPYVPLQHHSATIRYHDHAGRAQTFRYRGPLRPAVGDTVTVAHRPRRPQLPRLVVDSPGGPARRR